MVSALTGAMGAVLGKLTNLMGEEYAMLKGVRKKLESLRNELIAIHAFLEKYSAVEGPDVQAKAWTNEVRELAYDIEDSIDLFTYHVDREPADNTTGAKRFLRKVTKASHKVKKLEHRHKFAKQIQELQTHVNEVYERQKKYKLDEDTSSTTCTEIDPRLPALYMEVEKLVGIEGPSEEIISRFIGEEPTKQLKVVSIVGSGGSGKTTLAKQVYEKIKHQFKYTAFVSVSQKPNIRNLLRVLLLEIGSSDGSSGPIELYSDQQLIDKLRSYLEKESFPALYLPAHYPIALDLSQQLAPPIRQFLARVSTLVEVPWEDQPTEANTPRCSARLAIKQRLSPVCPVKQAQIVLMRKFGVIAEDSMPSSQDFALYEAIFSQPLTWENLQALHDLFRLSEGAPSSILSMPNVQTAAAICAYCLALWTGPIVVPHSHG